MIFHYIILYIIQKKIYTVISTLRPQHILNEAAENVIFAHCFTHSDRPPQKIKA